VKAERIDSSLHPRLWSFNRGAEGAARQVVLLTDGLGEAETDGERFAIVAPAIMWLGSMKPGRLRTEAGATGYRGWVSSEIVLAAIGDQPESLNLRYLADRDFALSLAGQSEQALVAERCFNGILNEQRQGQDGAALVLSGLLRIMLVALLRVSAGSALALPAVGERSNLLQRFRRLVEMNFRSHWTVGRYADALGISADRLHAICTGAVGKSPKALISERLAQEAAIRLERSSLTIQQLAHTLGFNDPAHFSHFFRKMMGMPPGSYRRTLAGSRADAGETAQRTFADWP
jgi:AraC family transcriptional regulator, transcriptional activator of pobA